MGLGWAHLITSTEPTNVSLWFQQQTFPLYDFYSLIIQCQHGEISLDHLHNDIVLFGSYYSKVQPRKQEFMVFSCTRVHRNIITRWASYWPISRWRLFQPTNRHGHSSAITTLSPFSPFRWVDPWSAISIGSFM